LQITTTVRQSSKTAAQTAAGPKSATFCTRPQKCASKNGAPATTTARGSVSVVFRVWNHTFTIWKTWANFAILPPLQIPVLLAMGVQVERAPDGSSTATHNQHQAGEQVQVGTATGTGALKCVPLWFTEGSGTLTLKSSQVKCVQGQTFKGE